MPRKAPYSGTICVYLHSSAAANLPTFLLDPLREIESKAFFSEEKQQKTFVSSPFPQNPQ
jgi:hypothetical protein